MGAHPDGLVAAKRASTKGRCLFCEEPLPLKRPDETGRRRIICIADACRLAYLRAYTRDRRCGISVASWKAKKDRIRLVRLMRWCAGASA